MSNALRVLVLAIKMSKRVLYIAAYDVSAPSRLRRIHRVVKTYATGGQKSVFECFLTPLERSELVGAAKRELNLGEDRFALVRVEERTRPILHGIAVPPIDPSFYYVG